MQEFTIWKNNKKTQDKHPDYRLNVKNERGEWIEIGAAWKRTVKGKVDQKGNPVTFLSCRLKDFTLNGKSQELTDEDKDFIQEVKAQSKVADEVNPEEIPF